MPLLRNSKNVNKEFDDTHKDKNVANYFYKYPISYFQNYDYSICKEDTGKNQKIVSLKKKKSFIIASGIFHL